MKYEVEFRNKSGEKKRVVVGLEPDEIRSVSTLRAVRGTDEAGLWRRSLAMRPAAALEICQMALSISALPW